MDEVQDSTIYEGAAGDGKVSLYTLLALDMFPDELRDIPMGELNDYCKGHGPTQTGETYYNLAKGKWLNVCYSSPLNVVVIDPHKDSE